jgi:hypothetical protein
MAMRRIKYECVVCGKKFVPVETACDICGGSGCYKCKGMGIIVLTDLCPSCFERYKAIVRNNEKKQKKGKLK